jgi:Niemann-Pick C1 protein
MRGLRFTLLSLVVSTGSTALAQGVTKIHEKGRCAIRGHCGKKSFFGGELPCPDNGLAREPDDDVREKLVGLCGSKWKEGWVCCEDEQVRSPYALLIIAAQPA